MIFASITIPILMSEQSEPSTRPTRAKKKKCEDKIIRDILKLQGDLITEHNTACLFTFSSKHGQLQFGSTNAVDKFKADFANDEEWQTAFNDDHDDLIQNAQSHDVDFDHCNHARGTLIAKKLPANVDLMIYVELWSWIQEETMKEHWLRGGKFKCVKWGDPDFEPSFWLGEIWDWEEVVKHPKDLKRSAYSGPGIMTDFLKKVVKNRLSMLGINPDMWVSKSFGEEERKRRERSRKKSTPSAIETSEEAEHDPAELPDEDERGDETDGESDGSDLSEILYGNFKSTQQNISQPEPSSTIDEPCSSSSSLMREPR